MTYHAQVILILKASIALFTQVIFFLLVFSQVIISRKGKVAAGTRKIRRLQMGIQCLKQTQSGISSHNSQALLWAGEFLTCVCFDTTETKTRLHLPHHSR